MYSKKSAKLTTIALFVFFIAGVALTLVLDLEGLKLLGPLLVGPGLTILFLGVLYDLTIGPLTNFGEKLDKTIAKMYRILGVVFILLGILMWVLG